MKKILLYGKHACIAALNNPKRKCHTTFLTEKAAASLPKNTKIPKKQIISNSDLNKLFSNPKDIIHQGIAVEVEPLPTVDITSLTDSRTIMVLDQITDPHNFGAILRSCAAFNIGGVICPKDSTPQESGVIGKSASAALEIIPICRVTNLVRSIQQLKKMNYWIVGLDGNSKIEIKSVPTSDKLAIVMGAEGKGLRHLTKTSCDMLVRLPISDKIESLNVSNAAAIASYIFSTK